MTIDSPNLYDEDAFKKGKQDFLDGKGLISNPYIQKQEEGKYGDWRIGWQTEKLEQHIKKRDNDEKN
jgi:hypothetical protein